jgi:hypothetical protein
MRTSKGLCSLLIAGAFVTVACGDSKSSLNPVAPSAIVVEGSQNVQSGGTVGPQGKGGVPGPPEDRGNKGNDPGSGKNPNSGDPGTPTAPGTPGPKKVQIEGLISATGGDSITVNGQNVVVPSTCPIRHGSTLFTFDDLHIGDRVHVTANKVTDSTGAVASITTLEATEVKLQNPGEPAEVVAVELTGLVSVTATDALAEEADGNVGLFTLTRSGSATLLAAPLSVTLTLTGTATNGTDFAGLPLTANFAAGVATAMVEVKPASDAVTEGPETVILTLGVTAPYEAGSPESATVTIADTPTPLVSVTAFDSTAAETGLNPGVFRFTRSVASAAPLTVTYTIAGNAQNGFDYQLLSGSVTIPAGAAFMDVTVQPKANIDMVGGSETVIVTLVDGAAYDLSAPATATVTIAP